MLEYLDKNLMQNIFNSNEFKEWLLSRRWFGEKYALSNLEFYVTIEYFEIIAEKIFISIIKIETPNYSKSYFLPLAFYRKIQDILEMNEREKDNIIKLTEITFSKKVVVRKQSDKIFTLNLVEAEHCLFFWKKILFDKELSETFPSLSLDLTLYSDQFQDEISLGEVQNFVEASLFPERYNFTLSQLGGGNTTNSIFMLNLFDKRSPEQRVISFVLKSYKEYSESVEPSLLIVLVKNNFPNAPKIYGVMKIKGIETVGIIENVQNVGNIGDIFWREVNDMINDVFKNLDADYSEISDKNTISNEINNYFTESIKISEQIGSQINKLHDSLIVQDDRNFDVEEIKSEIYLENYTEKLNTYISELQKNISQSSEITFYSLPKINSILIDVKDILQKFRTEFKEDKIKIQIVHQDLHMEQVLYNRTNEQYQFYFIDFEGDPQLSVQEKKGKFPIEKDVASFLRALSYIKFNTFLNFVERRFIQKDQYEVPEAILYNILFRKSARPYLKILETILKVLNIWEEKLIYKILKILKPNKTLVNYFTIERALYELSYELLFRPNKLIVPMLGLKELIERY